ncbi:MAG: hypothetical protein WCI55_12245 [Armatimonadota bacterium]
MNFDPGDGVPRVYPSPESYGKLYKHFGDESENGAAFWQAMVFPLEGDLSWLEQFLDLWTIENFDAAGIKFDPETKIVDGHKVRSLQASREGSFLGNVFISRPEMNDAFMRDVKNARMNPLDIREIRAKMTEIKENLERAPSPADDSPDRGE